MSPNCPCVGTAPSLYTNCCGNGCGGTVNGSCDWCASNNHPHFDLDDKAFSRLCGAESAAGSCKLAGVKPVVCLGTKAWPPGGGGGCGKNSFQCQAAAPMQPMVPGTQCCCNDGLTPQPDGSCR